MRHASKKKDATTQQDMLPTVIQQKDISKITKTPEKPMTHKLAGSADPQTAYRGADMDVGVNTASDFNKLDSNSNSGMS